MDTKVQVPFILDKGEEALSCREQEGSCSFQCGRGWAGVFYCRRGETGSSCHRKGGASFIAKNEMVPFTMEDNYFGMHCR